MFYEHEGPSDRRVQRGASQLMSYRTMVRVRDVLG